MKLRLQLMLFMESIFMFTGGLFGPLYAVFLTGIGGNLMDVGFASFLFFLTSGLGTYALGRWKSHFKHQENLYILGYFILAWTFLAYMIVGSVTQLFILQVIQGLGLALSVPTRNALVNEYNQKRRLIKWNYWESFSHTACALSAIVGSYLAFVQGFRTLFLFIFVLLIMGVGLFTFLHSKTEGKHNKELDLIKHALNIK